jgi:hypothetical protein
MKDLRRRRRAAAGILKWGQGRRTVREAVGRRTSFGSVARHAAIADRHLTCDQHARPALLGRAPRKPATASAAGPTKKAMIRNSLLLVVVGSLSLAACGGDDIDSDEEARRAYFGIDQSIEKSLALGFAGFNAASSANIPPQMTVGKVGGTLTITGQVDQGNSANKGMRLSVGMVDYSDGELVIEDKDGKETIDVDITYNTSADVAMQPLLDLKLMNIPNGTFNGTLTGTYTMKGDIKGDATLNLMFSGMIKNDGTGKTIRAPGTTTVTGTAVSGDGTYDVNLML